MSLDKATVARIATLARIKVPEADLDALGGRAAIRSCIGSSNWTRSTPPVSSR